MANDELLKYSDMFKALGHPTRLSIVAGLISCNECNVNTMVAKLGISQSTISQHLALLRRTGIVKFEKKGLEVCYRIEDSKIKKIIEIIDLECKQLDS
jgi:DNA-binding transcriptional ArsR family regulator